MEFQKRSQEDLLADLTSKLEDLPPKDPTRAILARMIVALRAELSAHKPQRRGLDEDGTEHANNEEDGQFVAEARQRWRVQYQI
jgi:hypothetical protein